MHFCWVAGNENPAIDYAVAGDSDKRERLTTNHPCRIRYERLEKDIAARHPAAGNFPKSVQSATQAAVNCLGVEPLRNPTYVARLLEIIAIVFSSGLWLSLM